MEDSMHSQQPQVQVVKPKRSAFLIFFASVGVIFFLFIILSIAGVVAIGLQTGEKLVSSISASGASGFGQTDYLIDAPNEPFLAEINFTGVVTPESADRILEQIKQAMEHDLVKGILLEVNSPGGQVVSSQEIYDKVQNMKAKKPVVAYVRELAASGAYYSIAPATRIFANRGSMIGSIGVIFSSMELTELYNWAHLEPIILKTGALKDAGNPNREMTPEDREYLMGLLTKTKDMFSLDVMQAREMSIEKLNTMMDGRVVLGKEAKELGLIDELGSKDQAVAFLNAEVKQKNLKLHEMKLPMNAPLLSLMGAASSLTRLLETANQHMNHESHQKIELR